MECQKIERLKKLQDLKDFAENANKEVNEMIKSVGWTVESIENFKPLLECPFNSSHHIREKRLEEHLERCQWKAEGYREWDVSLSEPTVPPNASSSIQFDEQLLEEVLLQAKLNNPTMDIGAGNRLIPRTSDRLISDFTSDERKAIYEYVVAQTIKPDVGEDIADLNKPKKESNKSSSYLDLLAQERDLKRRRAKHRGVHTNKKSQIEILREVINQQMEMLQEYIAERDGCEMKEDGSTIKNEKTYTCDDKKNNVEDMGLKNDKIKLEKEKRDHNYYHDNRDYYYKHYHDNHRDYDYYEDNRKDSSRNYQDDYEYSSRVHKSSRDYDRQSRKHYHSEERRHHRSYDRVNDHHSRPDKYDEHKDNYKRHKKHKRHKSRDRSSSRHSSKTKHGDEKSKKRKQ